MNIFLSLILFFTIISLSFSSNIISADVKVICPFNISAQTLPLYIYGSNIVVNYSISSLDRCSVGNVYGYITIYNHINQNTQYKRNISIPNIGSSYNSILTINSSNISSGYNNVYLYFNNSNTYNSTTRSFLLDAPANIIIKNISFISSPELGSQLNFNVSLMNVGDLSSNSIIMNVSISGPYNSIQRYIKPKIAPNESESITFFEPASASYKNGTYTLNISIEYNTSGYSNIKNTIKNKLISYTILQNGVQSHGSTNKIVQNLSSGLIIPTPALIIPTVPLYISVLHGAQSISDISFANPLNYSEILNLSVPSNFNKIIKLSSNNLYLGNGQSVYVQMCVSSNVSVGTYIIPFNISTHVQNGPISSRYEFITLYIYNKSINSPSISTQIQVNNNTKNFSSIIYVNAPENTTLNNITLLTKLPLSITNNLSEINAYGAPNKITESNGFYDISWNISSIQKGQNVILYYNVKNSKNQYAIQQFQNTFTQLTKSNNTNNLKIIKINIPTFYANSSSYINITSIYTGANIMNATFILSSYSNEYITNPIQSVELYPNKVFNNVFHIVNNNTIGTILFNLFVKNGNQESNYSIPVVSDKPPAKISNSSAVLVLKNNPNNLFLKYQYYIAAALLLLIVFIILISVKKYKGVSKYNSDRHMELIKLNERIKRGNSD